MATIHVAPGFTPITRATRIPIGVIFAIVESRDAYVAIGLLPFWTRRIAVSVVAYGMIGLPVAGFEAEFASKAIRAPRASNPSTQMNAESPIASGAQACVLGQRS